MIELILLISGLMIVKENFSILKSEKSSIYFDFPLNFKVCQKNDIDVSELL
jgi:hypothetical protein